MTLSLCINSVLVNIPEFTHCSCFGKNFHTVILIRGIESRQSCYSLFDLLTCTVALGKKMTKETAEDFQNSVFLLCILKSGAKLRFLITSLLWKTSFTLTFFTGWPAIVSSSGRRRILVHMPLFASLYSLWGLGNPLSRRGLATANKGERSLVRGARFAFLLTELLEEACGQLVAREFKPSSAFL